MGKRHHTWTIRERSSWREGCGRGVVVAAMQPGEHAMPRLEGGHLRPPMCRGHRVVYALWPSVTVGAWVVG